MLGTEYNGDYSFDGAGTITFRNMTLQSGAVDYLGFIRADKTVVEDCTMLGKTAYWGYTSATFKNTTFNCLKGDYALWSYSSATMTFDNCTFNSSGKVINVYNEGGTPNVEVNFKNCTVNNAKGTSKKAVLNINDRLVSGGFTINISGNNSVDGITADDMTCSCLFGFGGKEKNPEYVNGAPYYSNNKKTVVTINDVKVWENGERACAHNGVVFSEGSYNGNQATQYTDGYKDKAFIITKDDTLGYVKTCKYCGYTEPFYGELSNEIGLKRTVWQNGNNVNADAAKPNEYKVANSNKITVDYTATMNMENLRWEKQGSLSAAIPNPWQMLAMRPDWITEDTVVFLKFTFDKNIDLGTFQTNYNNAETLADKEKLLKLESNMFEIAANGVRFDTTNNNNTMTITCKWKEDANTNNSTITLKGHGLPVEANWGESKQINIENSGCVGGTVHIKNPGTEKKVARAETVVPNVAADVQVQNAPSLDSDYTIRIPIVGGCAADKFTLYYGGGSSGDSSGGSSGGGYYHPDPTPVPVIVIPPKTGDMTVWQSILHFLGIR